MTYDQDTLRHNMTNHPPSSGVIVGFMEELRRYAKDFGTEILLVCPDSRERSLALTNLEQALMWSVAAVARHQDRVDEFEVGDSDPGAPPIDSEVSDG